MYDTPPEIAPSLSAFFVEARDLLADIEASLRLLDADDPNPDLIDALFHATHTIKGSAGVFAIYPVVQYTHNIENTLQQLRDGHLAVSTPVIDSLFECHDHLQDLIARVRDGDEVDDIFIQSRQLFRELDSTKARNSTGFMLNASDNGNPVANDPWHISLRFAPDVFEHGFNPCYFLRYIARLGTTIHITTLPDSLPDAHTMNPYTRRRALDHPRIKKHRACTRHDDDGRKAFSARRPLSFSTVSQKTRHVDHKKRQQRENHASMSAIDDFLHELTDARNLLFGEHIRMGFLFALILILLIAISMPALTRIGLIKDNIMSHPTPMKLQQHILEGSIPDITTGIKGAHRGRDLRPRHLRGLVSPNEASDIPHIRRLPK